MIKKKMKRLRRKVGRPRKEPTCTVRIKKKYKDKVRALYGNKKK